MTSVSGVQSVIDWIWEGGPFPTFDTETPYTFGDADG